MVRDVRYITLNCCYRDLHNVLLTGHLKTLALVESAGETHTNLLIHKHELCVSEPLTVNEYLSNWCYLFAVMLQVGAGGIGVYTPHLHLSTLKQLDNTEL